MEACQRNGGVKEISIKKSDSIHKEILEGILKEYAKKVL